MEVASGYRFGGIVLWRSRLILCDHGMRLLPGVGTVASSSQARTRYMQTPMILTERVKATVGTRG